ncbi:hypothetical protein [Amycolatopsis sp. cmx-11-32]|uniref:hypothetical protein n=1 Tax=Amycolatopsis sp. cmx-11-32 TaxID=2785796 RepID=UPI0039E43783
MDGVEDHFRLERLRVDRQLEEITAQGPDPLRLASLFGIDPKTAARYINTATDLLVSGAEDHAARSLRTQASQPLQAGIDHSGSSS